MTHEEWTNEYRLFKSIIEENDFDSFEKAIEDKIPLTSVVLDMTYAHDVLWADALIRAGYDVRANKDLLYRAVGDLNVPYVKYLLRHGADPNVIVQNGYSTMNHIYIFGVRGPEWDDMVKALLESGGDPLPEQYCWSVAKHIFGQGSEELKKYYIDLLCEKGLITFTSDSNWQYNTVLDVAKQCSDLAVQEYIIDRLPNTKETTFWITKWAIESIFERLYLTEMDKREVKEYVDEQTFLNQIDLIFKEVYNKVLQKKILPDKEEMSKFVESVRKKEVGDAYAVDYERIIKHLEDSIVTL